ncbi:hypothetical protein JW877_01355, partial [bacterium]|nr:hypothetical protein [bacterium]
MTTRGKKILIGTILVVILILIYFFASRASTETFENLGLHMPLPLFTILISFVDGWNPCTLWMLTFILGVLVSIAHNRARVFIVGFSFVAVVFVFYYLFMAAWLNIYLLLGYIRIIRVIIAILAIVMGLINCKDFFFYKQGVSLIIP